MHLKEHSALYSEITHTSAWFLDGEIHQPVLTQDNISPVRNQRCGD